MIRVTQHRVVWIDVQFSGTKRVPKMDTLQHDFACWSLEQDIFPIVSGHAGTLGFSGGYSEKNAKKVRLWLKQQGVE